ncbi:D-aminoacyl-tRNA deacylase 2 [Holothuria leucospilota]|uniref:D-aminoacyl-tRNA deacylase n=1 Tax=Holothuria leucospilota TaxID=206669 RepID=A0A9Q0YNB1_HOLLE|nr:D-aminoacyl-tRNA deacylase 2 [Holothuria leucospilota]
MADDHVSMKGRIVMQQCMSARLQVKPPTNEEEAECVEVKRGVVIYICFLRKADVSIVEKMAKAVLTVRLCPASQNGKLVSILDLPGDVLIVPQSTLGGKAKGKMIQYHSNIDKAKGVELYHAFIEQCQKMLGENAKWKQAGCALRHGTYGIRQEVLRFDTDARGPFCHYFEF